MDFEFENVVVTGAAGFIGFHLCQRLLNDGIRVTGIDNMNPYYDVRLKEARLGNLLPDPHFTFAKLDLADRNGLNALFDNTQFDVVVNLAAQAGVRYSLENPNAYVDSNLFSNAAGITMSSTWYLLHPVRYTGRTPQCRFQFITMSTIRSHCMQRPKKPMS